MKKKDGTVSSADIYDKNNYSLLLPSHIRNNKSSIISNISVIKKIKIVHNPLHQSLVIPFSLQSLSPFPLS